MSGKRTNETEAMHRMKKGNLENCLPEASGSSQPDVPGNTGEGSSLSLRELAKRTAKDSVFHDLFQNPKYLLQLYQTLHPEDQTATEASIGIVTLKHVLLDQPYNDLGFTVGNRLLVLIEAQSTWSVNILVRSLMYLAQTWNEYIEATGQNLYGSRRVELPRPELYVIYTGERKARPEWISFSEEFFNGENTAVEARVKILYGGQGRDIISQYVVFTKVYNRQVKLYGQTLEAVTETIRICKDDNVLKDYLESREKEVTDIMMSLFDDETILRNYVKEKTQEAAKEAAKETAKKTAIRLSKKHMDVADIADIVGVSVSEVEEWLEEAAVFA